MKCIIGLGNPEKKYEKTKHNLGFEVITKIAKKLGVSVQKEKFRALFAKTNYSGEAVILMQPLTYMNRSGLSVSEVVSFYNLTPEDILIIHDDKDFDVGQIRIRKSGSSGGHNGVQSIIDALGTNKFPRIRVGIGSPERDQIAHVLSRFKEEEQDTIEKATDLAAEAAIYSINNTLDNTMNRYNLDVN